jgi:hypothetical protein
MTSFPVSSRQPLRTPWTRERLVHERAVALGCAIEPGTASSYSSALQSYLAFCKSHNFPIDPTPDTLSFFVVFMCHHIKPKSVESYLSGICNQLEPFFPIVRESRRIIQAIGRWASNAFQIYIRQHPVLLAAMLYGHQSV